MTAGRWELLRALGALVLDQPGQTDPLAATLGLPPWTAAGYTSLFVLALPPYAAIYLGPDGMLGGAGADRVAGVWRALGLTPPADADHLGAVLALYAQIGEAAEAAPAPIARERLDHAAAAVLWEHLWPWVPGYLDAARREAPPARPWADLLGRALDREARLARPPARPPLALRSAPAGIDAGIGYHDLLTALTAPVRAGFILTGGDLAAASRQLGLGLRRGERRFVLRALLDQDAAASLRWLGDHARGWGRRHRRRADRARRLGRPAASGSQADQVTADQWWADRALGSAAALSALADEARQRGCAAPSPAPGHRRLRPGPST